MNIANQRQLLEGLSKGLSVQITTDEYELYNGYIVSVEKDWSVLFAGFMFETGEDKDIDMSSSSKMEKYDLYHTIISIDFEQILNVQVPANFPPFLETRIVDYMKNLDNIQNTVNKDKNGQIIMKPDYVNIFSNLLFYGNDEIKQITPSDKNGNKTKKNNTKNSKSNKVD